MTKQRLQDALAVTTLILTFIMSIHLLGMSMHGVSENLSTLFGLAFGNPMIGLFIGLLSTAVLQSSSTTTTLAVTAVASGSLTLTNAIPVIMGANIGTTLTSTIVALSYVNKQTEFKKAISAGSVHDIFNILVVLILFPLEIKYGLLNHISQAIVSLIPFSETSTSSVNKLFLYRGFDWVGHGLMGWIGSFGVFALAVILLFGSVKLISNLLYRKLIGETRTKFESVAFSTGPKSFGWGFALTSVIQSSSLTTSLIVPLVATGKVKLKPAFQFIMGANLGTTITALLAAILKSEAAVSLAIAHFVFNFIGVALFLTIPILGKIPLYLANGLGRLSIRFRISAFAYILLLFFIIPFTLIYISKKSDTKADQPNPATKEQVSNNS